MMEGEKTLLGFFAKVHVPVLQDERMGHDDLLLTVESHISIFSVVPELSQPAHAVSKGYRLSEIVF